MIYTINEEPTGKKYKELMKYALNRSDVIMFVFRRDRYINYANYRVITQISKVLNIKIDCIEVNYKKYIENNYEKLYKNIEKILGKQMNLINELHKSSQKNVKELVKERLYDNIETEIEMKKNFLLQEEAINDFKRKFEKKLVKERHNPEWAGSKIICNKKDYKYKKEYLYDICFYKKCEEIKELLLKNTYSLYSFNPPYLPEDISFFKEGRCWLKTVTHERLGIIHVDTKKEYDYLTDLGIKLSEEYSDCREEKTIDEEYEV